MRKFKSENIVDKYTDMIYHIALKILQNNDDSEDIVQDVFVHYINYTKNDRGFNNEEHEKAWIIRVATNLCYDELKKSSKKDVPYNSELLTKTSFNEHETNIFDAINNLTEKYRKVFELFYLSDCKISEISKILNITESTAKTRLKRARDKYKKLLKDGGGEFSGKV